MKEAGIAHWNTPNTGATNSSGFLALPGGWRSYQTGSFGSIGTDCVWWSSQEVVSNTAYAYRTYLLYNNAIATRDNHFKKNGFSVRCIRD